MRGCHERCVCRSMAHQTDELEIVRPADRPLPSTFGKSEGNPVKPKDNRRTRTDAHLVGRGVMSFGVQF